jgi:hypothetical protein
VFDLKAFSAGVCDWMVGQGFKRATGMLKLSYLAKTGIDYPTVGHYYDLMGHFPHKFMTTNRVRYLFLPHTYELTRI